MPSVLKLPRPARNANAARRDLESDDPEAALAAASGIFGRYLGTVVRSLENRIAALEEKADRRRAPARA